MEDPPGPLGDDGGGSRRQGVLTVPRPAGQNGGRGRASGDGARGRGRGAADSSGVGRGRDAARGQGSSTEPAGGRGVGSGGRSSGEGAGDDGAPPAAGTRGRGRGRPSNAPGARDARPSPSTETPEHRRGGGRGARLARGAGRATGRGACRGGGGGSSGGGGSGGGGSDERLGGEAPSSPRYHAVPPPDSLIAEDIARGRRGRGGRGGRGGRSGTLSWMGQRPVFPGRGAGRTLADDPGEAEAGGPEGVLSSELGALSLRDAAGSREAGEERGAAGERELEHGAEARGKLEEAAEARGKAKDEAKARGKAKDEAEARGKAKDEAKARGKAKDEAKARGKAKDEAKAHGKAKDEAKARMKAKDEARVEKVDGKVKGVGVERARPPSLREAGPHRDALHRPRGPTATGTASFAPHLSAEELAAELAAGLAFRGRLRINRKNPAESYVSIPGLPRDACVTGAKLRNRAMDGDEVAVRVKVRSPAEAAGARARPALTATVAPSRPPPATRLLEGRLPAPPTPPASTGGPPPNDEVAIAALAALAAQNPDGTLIEGEVIAIVSTSDVRARVAGTLRIVRGGAGGAGTPRGLPAGPAPLEAGLSAADEVELVPSDPRFPVMLITRFATWEDETVGLLRGAGGGMGRGETGPRPTGSAAWPAISADPPAPSSRAWWPSAESGVQTAGGSRAPAEAGRELPPVPGTAAAPGVVTPPPSVVIASVDGWPADRSRPSATVKAIVGPSGELSTETAALMLSKGIRAPLDEPFDDAALAQLPGRGEGSGGGGGWHVAEADLAERADLRPWRVFSIDPPTARDLDDALSVERVGGGRDGPSGRGTPRGPPAPHPLAEFRVGVHIADVSHFVRPCSALDAEAALRSTSVYLPNRVRPMLPRELCEVACSLQPGVDRLSFSLTWDLDERGRPLASWAGRTVIRSCAQLSYGHAQAVIDASLASLGEAGAAPPSLPPAAALARAAASLDGLAPFARADGSPVEISPPHVPRDVRADVATLHALAAAMRRDRFEAGSLRLDSATLSFSLDRDGNPVSFREYPIGSANHLVEEFMLLANREAAARTFAAFPTVAVLRRHLPPPTRRIEAVVEKLAEVGIAISAESSGSLHRSLQLLEGESLGRGPSTGASGEGGRARRPAITWEVFATVVNLLTKPMQLAQYVRAGAADVDGGGHRHYALACDLYTHFTSPIRRYPDVLVHRLLQAALDLGAGEAGALRLPESLEGAEGRHPETPEAEAARERALLANGLPDAGTIETVLRDANDAKLSARDVQMGSSELYLLYCLHRRPLVAWAVAVGVGGPRYVDLYVPGLDQTTRVIFEDSVAPGTGLSAGWDPVAKRIALGLGSANACRYGVRPKLADVAGLDLGVVFYPSGPRSAPAAGADSPDDAPSIPPLTLPATVSFLDRIPILLSARNGDPEAGVPPHLCARLWLGLAPLA